MQHGKTAKIEIQVDDRSVSIWYGFQTYLRLWVNADGAIVASTSKFDDIEWIEGLSSPNSTAKELEVCTLVRQKEEYMAVPRLTSHRVADGEVIKPHHERERSSGGSHSGTGMATTTRDVILNDILDSMLASPNATKAHTERESTRIAKENGVSVGSVAAVRANLTRGTYGLPDEQLRLRASYLRRNAPLRGMLQAGQRVE